jgi:hypothetical protein
MKPYAIAMWDFSWLERPEYDDWDKSLDELQERGYNALRIECYPSIFPSTKVIDPIWSSNDWGSSKPVNVESFKLLDFLAKCKGRDIKVGLSTWGRGWQYNYDFCAGWEAVLDNIMAFKDSILFVDLTNEFPMDLWTKYSCGNSTEEKFEWANNTLLKFKENYDYKFCFTLNDYNNRLLTEMDYINMNIWIASVSGWQTEVGYSHRFWDNDSYNILVEKGEEIYRAKEEQWKSGLSTSIDALAEWSRKINKYIICTEGWGPIDYKDYPGLNWGWVKEICAYGVEKSIASGQFIAICTSNFCGPQFKGMWEDVEWHKKLTRRIKNGG